MPRGEYCEPNHEPSLYHSEYGFWQPLADDGDALRLAVTLRIEFEWWKNGVSVKREDQSPMPIEYVGDDPYAATRRAVVRAAAELGRSMT